MVRLCPGCGAENEDDASRCEACGDELGTAGVGDVEIEVYDVEPLIAAPKEEKYFDETLARAREVLPEEEPEEVYDVAGDAVLREELRPGYEIRQRRLSHRSRRRRNLLILIGATAVLAVAVVYGVRWALARMPKYEYAESAAVASTNLTLEMAAELESTPVDLAAAEGGPTATLAVSGDQGKIFVDGYYVGDAPTEEVAIPLGRHHVIVKRGHQITLDETIDFRLGERYSLEPTGAAALAGGP
jgi:hypothetical protein